MGKWRVNVCQLEALQAMGHRGYNPENPFHVFCKHFPSGLLASENFCFGNDQWCIEAHVEMRATFASHLESTGVATEMAWLQEVWPSLNQEIQEKRAAKEREVEERMLRFGRLTYQEKITKALVDLENRQGSSLVAIKNYIDTHQQGAKALHINKALKKGVLDGSFVKKGGKYKVGKKFHKIKKKKKKVGKGK